jgi:hypothetical protein
MKRGPRTRAVRHERGLVVTELKRLVADRVQQEVAAADEARHLVLLAQRHAEALAEEVCKLVRAAAGRAELQQRAGVFELI